MFQKDSNYLSLNATLSVIFYFIFSLDLFSATNHATSTHKNYKICKEHIFYFITTFPSEVTKYDICKWIFTFTFYKCSYAHKVATIFLFSSTDYIKFHFGGILEALGPPSDFICFLSDSYISPGFPTSKFGIPCSNI